MRHPAACLLLLLVVCVAERAEARAWTRDAGKGTVRLTYSYLGADGFYSASGNAIEIPDYSQHTVDLFAEVGLIDRWLTLSLEGTPYRWNTLKGQGRSRGAGDFRVGAWSGLLVTDDWRLTAGVLVGLPTGDDRKRIDPFPTPSPILADLPNGDGEADVQLRLALGSSLGFLGKAWPLRHFLELELGYWYHSDQAEAVLYSFKLGTKLPWGFLERVWFIVELFGVESTASRRSIEPILTGVGDGVSFTAYAFEVSVEVLDGIEVFSRVDGAARARALPEGAVISAGVGCSF